MYTPGLFSYFLIFFKKSQVKSGKVFSSLLMVFILNPFNLKSLFRK